MTDIQSELFSMQDLKYRDFHLSLIPTVPAERIIGVRTPQLRKYAKTLAGTERGAAFLNELPHRYYEENNLHAFIAEKIRDFDEALAETKRFLPYIDNWATCDAFMPGVFKKHKAQLLPEIKNWIASDSTYTVRFGTGLLMKLYLDEDFEPELLGLAASVKSSEYYIRMMVAWYFATALAKQYDAALPYLTEKRLDKWVHNKTVQKATESYRIPPETKSYLKTLKIK